MASSHSPYAMTSPHSPYIIALSIIPTQPWFLTFSLYHNSPICPMLPWLSPFSLQHDFPHSPYMKTPHSPYMTPYVMALPTLPWLSPFPQLPVLPTPWLSPLKHDSIHYHGSSYSPYTMTSYTARTPHSPYTTTLLTTEVVTVGTCSNSINQGARRPHSPRERKRVPLRKGL